MKNDPDLHKWREHHATGERLNEEWACRIIMLEPLCPPSKLEKVWKKFEESKYYKTYLLFMVSLSVTVAMHPEVVFILFYLSEGVKK